MVELRKSGKWRWSFTTQKEANAFFEGALLMRTILETPKHSVSMMKNGRTIIFIETKKMK